MGRHHLLATCISIGMLLSHAAALWAQQPEPPDDLSDERLQQALTAPEPNSAAVEAILVTDPSTPAEWARAAKILADLGRPDLGKGFLKQIIDAKLGPPQLALLAEQFGSPMFVQMAANPDMLPEARQLAVALLAAANDQLQDPQHIAGLIRHLQDPAPQVRYQALMGLKEARDAAVGPLIGVLADPARQVEHSNVRAVLARMGSDAVGPLMGVLSDAQPELAAQAMRILAQMDAKEATVYLLRPYLATSVDAMPSDAKVRAAAAAAINRLLGHLPSKPEAVRMLTHRAKAYFDCRQPIPSESDGRVPLWRWDAEKKQCIAKQYSTEDASLRIAARLARDASMLADEDAPEIRVLYLATMLEAAVYENGPDNPLPTGGATAVAEAAEHGVAMIEEVMQYGIAGNHIAAATAAARILGQIGTADELLYRGPQPSPLARALRHPNRRLRMAAAEAVVRLHPTRPFPGSSHVPESLAFFAATGGVRRALIAGPSTETSREIAGPLAALGFQVDTAVTGRELIRLATTSPDYELALIDAATERPTIDLLLQRLRRDSRSADLRVGLIARSGHLTRAEQVARRDAMTLAFSRPHSAEAIHWQVDQLQSLDARIFTAHPHRQHQAAAALGLLAEISGPDNTIYDVRRVQRAMLMPLYVPQLGSQAAAVLTNCNSAESQQALVELASRWTQPLETRKAAVSAFRVNTRRHGILLTTDEIQRQYDRYNQSEELDPGTQQVLALILDCIEAPTQPVRSTQEDQEEDAQKK